MSLILFAFVVRVRDGLPLSASTDFEHNKELQERKQQLKTVSKALSLLPERGTVKGKDLNIYFISSEGVSYMTICSSSFSAAMAFCFLEDLRWEFRASYDNTSIGLVSRPYPFLEFDSVIQKIKHHYSYSSFPSLRMNLAAVEEELRVRPSKILTAEDMVMRNGTANGHAQPVSGTAASERMEPVTGLGILSLLLNIMCASLNLIRGVHLIEYTLQDGNEGIWNVVAFLLAFFCCLWQCYLYLFFTSVKKLQSFLALAFVFLCNIYLYGLRNIWQLLFHTAVASLSTCQISTRKLQEKLDDCGV
ncbi:vesicle-trafficking protein SEC22c-like [Acipenser ruthenus]|uniref:vesicle-trafficking protein SEC22c-like n=1 Tax=Acipenser ruthenus TaxID=7906 RepID=UPI00145B55C3|nr:vesicle-trafficking protein SEC22c-like [Acipenser ruthenus]